MDKKDIVSEKSGLKTGTLEIISLLKNEYPDAKIALRYRDPLELLVATILSAQCTDVMVNKVTQRLFEKYRTPRDYLKAPIEELQNDIRQAGFFRNKARSIRGAAQTLLERFDGEVPKTMEEILQLPGVARKTANVVLGNAYGVVEGIAVDTHVFRLAHRLGLSRERTAEKVEKDLMELVPKDDWFKFTYLLIEHGRKICQARKPKCHDCVLVQLCPSAFIFD